MENTIEAMFALWAFFSLENTNQRTENKKIHDIVKRWKKYRRVVDFSTTATTISRKLAVNSRLKASRIKY